MCLLRVKRKVMDIKRVITVSCALVFCIMAIISVSNKDVSKDAPSMEAIPEEMEQKILSFDLANYAENGMKKWNLKGDSADVFAEVVNLEHIDMETYEDPKITLTALKGSYNKVNKEISLYDDVEILTSEGARLSTDFLKWHGDSDTITTDRPVRIVRSDVIANGDGAYAYPQMKRIILNNNVTVKLANNVIGDTGIIVEDIPEEPLDDNSGATITCKGPMQIDYEANLAVFNDDVMVDDKKGKILSDKMEAFLDPVSKNIVKVVAEGNVEVIRGEDSTYSQKAIYTTSDSKIVLLGRPRIVIRSEEELNKLEKGFGSF